MGSMILKEPENAHFNSNATCRDSSVNLDLLKPDVILPVVEVMVTSFHWTFQRMSI